MELKLVPAFLIFLIFWGLGGILFCVVLREQPPLGLPPLLGTWLKGLFLLAPFMALFHKQNSAGENP